MGDLTKLRALSGEERRLLAQCTGELLFIVLALRLCGFRRLRAALARWPRRGPARFASEAAASARAAALARMVAVAATRGPVRATCLARSLLLWRRLRADGIDTVLRVGVRRDGADLRAHAWVERNGSPLGEQAHAPERFDPFDEDLAAFAERRR